MTSRPGRRSITICAAGSAKGSGRGFITRWSWPTGSAPDAKLRSFALGCHHRQPDRQDGGSKGGLEGCDAGKKVHGRKRHIMTDTDGRLLAVEVHAADIQDRDGAKGALKRSR